MRTHKVKLIITAIFVFMIMACNDTCEVVNVGTIIDPVYKCIGYGK